MEGKFHLTVCLLAALHPMALHLDALDSLLDALQQVLVLRVLVALLVGVHVCQCIHIGIKVLLTNWILQPKKKKGQIKLLVEEQEEDESLYNKSSGYFSAQRSCGFLKVLKAGLGETWSGGRCPYLRQRA